MIEAHGLWMSRRGIFKRLPAPRLVMERLFWPNLYDPSDFATKILHVLTNEKKVTSRTAAKESQNERSISIGSALLAVRSKDLRMSRKKDEMKRPRERQHICDSQQDTSPSLDL